MRIHADTLTVDDDEGRYVLVIDGGRATIDIHDCVLDFYASVQREIRPYALEAESARRSMPVDQYDADLGYARDDPKHPTFHDRMADLYDSREGK